MGSRDVATGGSSPGAVGRPRSQELDARILSAALELLADEASEFRMERVAVKACVPRSTIHRRWPSRSALRAAAIVRFLEERFTVPDTGSLRGDLSALVSETLANFGTPLGLRVVAATLELMTDPNEGTTFASVGAVARRQWLDCRAIVERAVARGELPPTASADLVLEMMVGAMWAGALHFTPRDDTVHLGALVDAVVQVAATWSGPDDPSGLATR